jgi:hypothetical protein
MTRRHAYLIVGALLALWAGAGYVLQAQTLTASELRGQLAMRFEIVAMQRGIGLIPRQADSKIQIIQVADGTVALDGQMLTAAQLRERLGADANAVIQLTYLDRDALRALVGAPAEPVLPQVQRAPDESRNERRGNDRVRFGGRVTVGDGERVDGDVVGIFGPVDVDGEVMGDVVAIMGPLTLGPHALVHGDVQAIGGPMTRAPEARVLGQTNEIAIGSRIGRRWTLPTFGTFGSRVGSFAATTARLLLFVLLGLLIVAAVRRPVERIAATASAHPWKAVLVGLLAEILFIPAVVVTIIMLVVSIIGIPLLLLVPFGIVLVCLVMLVGFVGAAHMAGSFAMRRLGREGSNAYVTIVTGTVVIVGMTVLAKLAALAGGGLVGIPLGMLGYLIEYCAWTMGFGAAILAWFAMRRTPPLPPTPEPAAV